MAQEARALLERSERELRERQPAVARESAQKALQLFRDAGDGDGAAAAVALAVRAFVASGSPAAGADLARQALAACKKAKDVRGEASALLSLAHARLAGGEADAAMAAARRAATLFKELPGGRESQADALSVIASGQFEKGYWELSLRAAREARQALQAGEAAGAAASSTERRTRLTAEVECLVARAHHARGEEPPSTANRVEALKLLQEMGKALQDKSGAMFDKAYQRLQELGGYSDTDTSRAFSEALDADPDGAGLFLAQHMPARSPFPGPASAWAEEGALLPEDYTPTVASLRVFPTMVQLQQPPGAADDTVFWQQSMGQLWVTYTLRDGPSAYLPGGWAQEDIVVEMSQKQLKVTLGGQPVKLLTGEFMEDIWRKDSWWTVDEEEALLVITLFKRRQLSWAVPWYSAGTGKLKRTAFPWTEKMTEFGTEHNSPLHGYPPAAGLPDEAELAPVAPGRPAPEPDEPVPGGGYARSVPGGVFAPRGDDFICRAQDLCLGITADQDSKQVIIQVHFERFAFDNMRQRIPVEKLLAADVWPKALCIFFQGDKINPIVWGELAGDCLPYQTTWRLVSSEPMRRRQEQLGSYSPALEVRIRKAPHSWGMWPKIFDQCVQAKLMEQRWLEGHPRFTGLADVPTGRRAGYDLNEPDFWSFVEDYCHETFKKIGHSTAPKKLVLE